MYPDAMHWPLLAGLPARAQDFLFGMLTVRLKNYFDNNNYLHMEVTGSDTLHIDQMLIPWFQNYHAIFPIRSPQVFDFFKQGTDMPMNGLTYDEYFSDIIKKMTCEEKWTQQWTEKLNEQYSSP